MKCSRATAPHGAIVDGVLPKRIAACVQEHIHACALCAARQKTVQRIHESLVVRPEVHLPEGFSVRVMNAVHEYVHTNQIKLAGAAKPLWLYRRLGYSFVLSAAMLVAGLFIPAFSYTRLMPNDCACVQQQGTGQGKRLAKRMNWCGG